MLAEIFTTANSKETTGVLLLWNVTFAVHSSRILKLSFSKIFGKYQQNAMFLAMSLFYHGVSTLLITNIFALPHVA